MDKHSKSEDTDDYSTKRSGRIVEVDAIQGLKTVKTELELVCAGTVC